MTFEEFFTKKRIDLALLRRAKPDLYEEFRDHYAQMSEKSFDHTKKYWFNRLRKDFLLEVVEPLKAVNEREPKAAQSPTSAAPAAKPAESSSVRPSGFKPRFKPNVAKPADAPSGGQPEDKVKPEETVQPESTKPVGFKPRFKPGATEVPTPEPAAVSKPVGFKPRFKAGTTPVKKVEREDAGKTASKKDDTDTT